MRSSYIQNNYGEIFYNQVTTYPPVIAVELGVLDGYSTLHIARALSYNRTGHLDTYDLFDNYEFNHGSKQEVEDLINKEGLSEFVSIFKEDAFSVYNKYNINSVHFLHVDLSNTGGILRKIIEQWHDKMVYGGFILFEGGSEERDNIEWMVKYNKEPIKKELEANPIINSKYIYGTYLNYPSLTVLLRRG